MENRFVYKSPYTGDKEVELVISSYVNNGAIYLGLNSIVEGGPFGDITVNLSGRPPDYCGYLDTNNLPGIDDFIKQNDLGEFTGFVQKSGFCDYPLYFFNVDKIREVCPEGAKQYEESIGMVKNGAERERGR